MVFVKVRETYDLHTTKNKMTVIGIHTPKPDIIKRSYPGLLMQCKMYRPVSCDVRVACASIEPLDPKGVGLEEGDVAPEDVFNPILYKAMSNKGMSQLEARLNALSIGASSNFDVSGDTTDVEVDSFTTSADEFNIYYGLLSNTHEWKHANPQAGLEMRDLRPLVYEVVYNVGDVSASGSISQFANPASDGQQNQTTIKGILGNAKPMPFINCTAYSGDRSGQYAVTGFNLTSEQTYNCEQIVPYLHVMCGCIIVPPSRLHSLYYRLVCEWTLEFSQIRPVSEINDFVGLGNVGATTHYQNYSYESTKAAITGDPSTVMDSDSCMISANVDVTKVM